MNNKKRNNKQLVIFFVLIVIIIVLYFYFASKRTPDSAKIPSTEAKKLLTIDMSTDYPTTPTSVVKLFSRISKCLYNDKWDNDEVNELIIMIRRLYSKELLENNLEEKYSTSFKADIADYQDKKKTIMTYRVDGNSNIETWEKDNKNYASLNVAYSVAEKKKHYKIYEKFILIQEDKQWKIVGWTYIPETEIVED